MTKRDGTKVIILETGQEFNSIQSCADYLGVHVNWIKNILRETDIFKEEIKIEYFTKFTKELQNIIKDTSERKVFIMDIELETKVSGIDIAKYIRENYGEELKKLGVPLYDLILNREFSSFLESKGYITPTRFPKKNGDGLEEKVHFQPLQPFLDYFVENSMAIVKDLNDGRGKIIFNYTKNIQEYITSKEFYDEFMKYIKKIYTNEEEEIITLL